jgi:hypothetical protein
MELRNDQGLASMLDLPDDQIDLATRAFMQQKTLVRLGSANPAHALFYPDGGMFSMATRDPGCLTGWSWGMAVPLLPSIAFAWVSESADFDWLFEQCRATPLLRGLSMSGPKASRVVLPPDLAVAGLPQVLTSELLRYRREMDAYRAKVQEVRAAYLCSRQENGDPVVLVDQATERFALQPKSPPS